MNNKRTCSKFDAEHGIRTGYSRLRISFFSHTAVSIQILSEAFFLINNNTCMLLLSSLLVVVLFFHSYMPGVIIMTSQKHYVLKQVSSL